MPDNRYQGQGPSADIVRLKTNTFKPGVKLRCLA